MEKNSGELINLSRQGKQINPTSLGHLNRMQDLSGIFPVVQSAANMEVALNSLNKQRSRGKKKKKGNLNV